MFFVSRGCVSRACSRRVRHSRRLAGALPNGTLLLAAQCRVRQAVTAHIGELIGDMAVAITHRLDLGPIGKTIHAYPTQSDESRRAADAWPKTASAARARLLPAARRRLRLVWTMLGAHRVGAVRITARRSSVKGLPLTKRVFDRTGA